MKLSLLFIVVIGYCSAQAQQGGRQLADSLAAALPAVKDDTVKARLYNRLFNEWQNINREEAVRYAQMGLAHVERMKWPKGIAVFRDNMGRIYSDRGHYDSAIFFYNAALAAHLEAGDKKNIAVSYNNMGTAAMNMRSDYTVAADHYFKALQTAEEAKDSVLTSVSLHNIASLYIIQQDFTRAIEFETRALRIREKLGVPKDVAASYETMGSIQYSAKNMAQAKQYYYKAIGIYEDAGDQAGLASALSNLAMTAGADYRSNVELRLRAQKLWYQVNPLHISAITNTGNLGIAYFDVVRYDTAHQVRYGDVLPDNKTMLLARAEENLTMAIRLCEQTGEFDARSVFMGNLSEVQAYRGDYKNAYYNFKAYSEIQDSIYSQENKNRIASAESRREMDKKNSELEINRLALANQQRKMLALAAGIILLGIIGLLLYRQNRVRKKNNALLLQLNDELDKANKVKARFFGILSHDLRKPVANLINFLHLQKNEPGLLDGEQAEAHRKKITGSAESLLETMETVLLWSKGQMENFKPVKTNVSIGELFEQLAKAFPNSEQLSTSYHNPDNISVHTDGNYLYTILYNLASNAAGALEKTPGGLIEWKAWKNEHSVFISIQDNGPGLPAAITGNWDNDAEINSGKHGFGLHIVKDMAKAIGAKISFPRVERGTLVLIELTAGTGV